MVKKFIDTKTIFIVFEGFHWKGKDISPDLS